VESTHILPKKVQFSLPKTLGCFREASQKASLSSQQLFQLEHLPQGGCFRAFEESISETELRGRGRTWARPGRVRTFWMDSGYSFPCQNFIFHSLNPLFISSQETCAFMQGD
jgi:hypothetical protein